MHLSRSNTIWLTESYASLASDSSLCSSQSFHLLRRPLAVHQLTLALRIQQSLVTSVLYPLRMHGLPVPSHAIQLLRMYFKQSISQVGYLKTVIIYLRVLLIYYLSKSRTGFERTDSIIARICRTTVEAAVPVTILCVRLSKYL